MLRLYSLSQNQRAQRVSQCLEVTPCLVDKYKIFKNGETFFSLTCLSVLVAGAMLDYLVSLDPVQVSILSRVEV